MRQDMPTRLLRLLSLLQTRREWSGAELAERLGVTARTVRRDIDRLRALDYPVDSAPGTAGGYRLTSGASLPPLLLDDDEVVAVALGLVTAGGAGVSGIADSAVRALAKLERGLPARLRPRLAAVGGTSVAVPAAEVPAVDPVVLGVLAACCRDQEIVTFDYRGRAAADSARRVEPHHLVTVRGHWYLVAHDLDREDWRSFRVDRLTDPRSTRRRFTPRPLPAPDPAAYLARSFASAEYRHRARLAVSLPADELRRRLFTNVPGEIESVDPGRCTVRLSAESAELVALYASMITALDAEVTVLESSPDVKRRLRAARRRLPE
ncbi:helix-turn-helix transcriptional regulator [Saccharomonospora azurea]